MSASLGPDGRVTAWPRPPRWLGGGLLARLSWRDVARRRRAVAATALPAFAAGALLAGASPGAAARSWSTIGLVSIIALAASVAAGTDPTQRADADLLVRLGWPRASVRLASWLSGAASVGVPAAIGAVGARLAGAGGGRGAVGLGIGALALSGLGAAVSAGARLPERLERAAARRRIRLGVRAGLGLALLALGIAAPIGSETGSDVDLALPVATFLALLGVAGMAPLLLLAAGTASRRLPGHPWRLAGAMVIRHHRALTVPFLAVAGAACILVTQGVLGEALGRREAARRAELRDLGTVVAAGPEDVVVVDAGLSTLAAEIEAEAEEGPGPEAVSLAARIAEAAPEASIVPVEWVEVDLRSGVLGAREATAVQTLGFLELPAAPSNVGLATSTLLTALDLDPSLSRGEEAIVLDGRAAQDGVVVLVARSSSGGAGADRQPPIELRAERPRPDVTIDALPPVLIPPALAERHGLDLSGTDVRVLARFPGRPSDGVVRAIERAEATTVVRGDARVDLADRDRTDRVASVWVRDGGGTARLAVDATVLAVLALAAGLVALRLAVREERATLQLLGARRRTQVGVLAAAAATVTAAAVAIGAGAALLATRLGMASYNAGTRASGIGTLDPLTWSVPPAVGGGLLALLGASAALGALVAAVSPPGRGDRSDDRHPLPSGHV